MRKPWQAGWGGRKELLEFIIKNTQMSIESHGVLGKTALHLAIQNNKLKTVEYLLNAGANILHRDCMDKNVLHIVGKTGNIEIAKLLLKKLGGDCISLLRDKNYYYFADLCFEAKGCKKGNNKWYYLQIDRQKVSVFYNKYNRKTIGDDFSHYGKCINSGNGDNPASKDLKKVQNKFNKSKFSPLKEKDSTPLHDAIFSNRTEVAQLFLEQIISANETSVLDTQDHFHLSPAMLAASTGNLEMIQSLEEAGADTSFNSCDKEGHNIKDIAQFNEHDDIVWYLQNRDGKSGAHLGRGELTRHEDSFQWKITNYDQILKDAEEGKRLSFFSPSFHTKEGYKMCLRIYPNGNGDGRGTHMSLFIAVMMGVNDDNLKWPICHYVTLSLMAQDGSHENNISDRFQLGQKKNDRCSQKPRIFRNHAIGTPFFITKNELKPIFLVDNSILIKVTVGVEPTKFE